MFNIIEIVKCEMDISWKEVSKLKKCYFHHVKHQLIIGYDRLVYIRNKLLTDIEESVRYCRKRDFDIEKDYISTIHEFENLYFKYCSFIHYINGGEFPKCH